MTRPSGAPLPQARLEALEAVLRGLGRVAVAVSGGVDSMTLSFVAHRVLASHAEMIHAASPAVPGEATARVRDHAERYGWRLQVLDAGEFADPAYRSNPVDRCYFCKTNLYGAIGRRTDAVVVSGANLDDLGDYRPGLTAAREHGVRHPFVEADIDKATVRAIARHLGLHDVAELVAAPCLASRIETGIRVEPADLGLVHAVEKLVSRELRPKTVRCRLRRSGVVIELDEECYNALSTARQKALGQVVSAMFRRRDHPVSFAPYCRGSAFLTAADEPS